MISHTAASSRTGAVSSKQDICRSIHRQSMRSLIHEYEIYLFHALLIDDHAFELCILPVLGFYTSGFCYEASLMSFLFLLTYAISDPTPPAGKCVVNDFIILIFDGLLLLSLEVTNHIGTGERSLDEFLISEGKW